MTPVSTKAPPPRSARASRSCRDPLREGCAFAEVTRESLSKNRAGRRFLSLASVHQTGRARSG